VVPQHRFALHRITFEIVQRAHITGTSLRAFTLLLSICLVSSMFPPFPNLPIPGLPRPPSVVINGPANAAPASPGNILYARLRCLMPPVFEPPASRHRTHHLIQLAASIKFTPVKAARRRIHRLHLLRSQSLILASRTHRQLNYPEVTSQVAPESSLFTVLGSSNRKEAAKLPSRIALPSGRSPRGPIFVQLFFLLPPTTTTLSSLPVHSFPGRHLASAGRSALYSN